MPPPERRSCPQSRQLTNYSMWLLTGFCDSVTVQTELPVSARRPGLRRLAALVTHSPPVSPSCCLRSVPRRRWVLRAGRTEDPAQRLFPVHSGKATAPRPTWPAPLTFPSVLTAAACRRPLQALPFSAWDTLCPGTDSASSLTSCRPGLHAPSRQDLAPAALCCNHPSPVSFFLHHHRLPTGRTTSSFLACLSPPPQNRSSWKAGPCPVDPEFLDTDWHTVAPTKNFWRMNELSPVSTGPSVWPVGRVLSPTAGARKQTR